MTLMALADAAAHRSVFESAIGGTEPDAVQVASVNALGRIPGDAAPVFLLSKWPTLTPSVRSAAATVILSRPEGARAMLDALRSGAVKTWMLNFWHKRSLIMNRDEAHPRVRPHRARRVARRARADRRPLQRGARRTRQRGARRGSVRARRARCAIRSTAAAAWRWGPTWPPCAIGRCRCCSPTSSNRAARSRSTTKRIRSKRASGDDASSA